MSPSRFILFIVLLVAQSCNGKKESNPLKNGTIYYGYAPLPCDSLIAEVNPINVYLAPPGLLYNDIFDSLRYEYLIQYNYDRILIVDDSGFVTLAYPRFNPNKFYYDDNIDFSTIDSIKYSLIYQSDSVLLFYCLHFDSSQYIVNYFNPIYLFNHIPYSYLNDTLIRMMVLRKCRS